MSNEWKDKLNAYSQARLLEFTSERFWQRVDVIKFIEAHDFHDEFPSVFLIDGEIVQLK